MKREPDFQFARRNPSGTRYFWKKWTEGASTNTMIPIRLTQGVDFSISPAAMRTAVYQHAKQVGLKAHTAVQGNDLIFVVYAEEETTDE